MYLKKEKLADLLNDKAFEGNYNKLARELGVNPSQLHRILNNENSEAGAIFLGKLKVFCNERNLDFDEFIILPSKN